MMSIYYKTDDDDWALAGTVTPDSDYEEYPVYINRTSMQIQFKFVATGQKIDMREYKIMEPLVERNR